MCPLWLERTRRKELTDEEILKIVEDMASWGVKKLILSGGEPLLRKRLVSVVALLCQQRNIDLDVITNGTLLDLETAKQLVSANLSRITVSIDGIETTHDSIKQTRHSFKKALQGIDNILKAREELKKQTSIHINTVMMHDNLDELMELVKLAENRHAIIWFQALHIYDAERKIHTDDRNPLWIQKKELYKLDDTLDSLIYLKKRKAGIIGNPTLQLKKMKQYYRNPDQFRFSNCITGFNSMYITGCGDVLPCWFWKEVGNVRNTNLKDIWRSKNYQVARMKMQNCTLPCLLNCHYVPGPIGNLVYDLIYLPVYRRLTDTMKKS